MKDLHGKVAVITGGASGIGLASARSLAQRGVKLVLADIEEGALNAATKDLAQAGASVIGVRTDVADLSSMQALAQRAWSEFGGVDIVFNNAGVAVFGPTQSMTHADWQWSLNVNLWGPIHGVEAFVPRMVEQRRAGHLLFTASFAGLVSNRNLGPYSVTKAAVVSLAECLAKDLRDAQIGVSVLCPMRVATHIDDSHRNRPAELGGPQAQTEYADKNDGNLSGRTLAVEQIGELVVDGILNDRLYLITHREAEPFISRRFDRLKAALDSAL